MKELKTIRDILNAVLFGHEVEINDWPRNNWEPIDTIHVDIKSLDDEKAVPRKFRIKPTKPSIDWSHVSKKYNCLARDQDGQVYLYENKPKITEHDCWSFIRGICISAAAFKSLDVGTCDWKDSLVERPKE